MFDPDKLEETIQKMPMDRYMAEVRRLTDLVKKRPKDWEARFVLALFLMRTESYQQAVLQLKKATKLNPRSEVILKTLCEVMFLAQKDYKNAIGYLKKWSLMRKDLAVLWIYIAQCQNSLEKPKEGLVSLQKAEAIDPKHPDLRLTRADIYAKIGDEAAAQREFELSYDETGQIKALSGLMGLPNFKPNSDQLKEIKDKVLEEEPSAQFNRRSLLSEIGTAYEKLKIYDDAFDCFKRSNDERVSLLDKEEQLAPFKNIRETFTKEFLLSRAGNGHRSKQPIFIVGMPRSGTTLTESILAAHPQIVDKGEVSFFAPILNRNGAKLVQSDLLNNRLPGLKGFMNDNPDGWFNKTGQDYLETVKHKKNDKKHLVDKLPHNFLAVGLIHLVFPEAKIIHCRRHPYDGALSCYKASFSEFHDYATDLSFLGSYYRNYWDLMQYWRDLLPGKMFEICYEHVVSETETVARNIIDHIGLKWDERCLDHTRSKKSVRTASQWQVRQPIYTSSVAKWRNYEKQLEPMIKAMGSIAADYESELMMLQAAE